jgi:hypothetical protein
MKTGEIVMIYTAPVTRRLSCGEAELIEFIDDYGACEFWKVRFIGNGYTENVLIKKDDGTDTTI